jgi:hypothetical protein
VDTLATSSTDSSGDTPTDDTWDRLAAATQLLHRAAAQVWADAGEDHALQSFGFGVFLAQAEASALLPREHPVPTAEDLEDLEEQGALQLLAAAEELTRPLPAQRPDLINRSPLVLDLCDLIREARELGY